jgi:predicted O-methyltransferase YrrM
MAENARRKVTQRSRALALLKEFYPAHRAYRALIDWKERWRYHAIVKRHGLPVYDESGFEKVRKDIVAIELCRSLRHEHPWLDIPIPLVGGAADHKLIYLVARSLLEQKPRRVLEFGAGATTRLLASYARENPEVEIVTVEENAAWADRMRPDVANHRMTLSPLVVNRSDRYGDYYWYDLDIDRLGGAFDFVIVDGPVGTPFYSRVGFVDRSRRLLAREWVVLWDDVHRSGDLESFAAFVDTVRQDEVPADCSIATSMRGSTGVAFTPAYSALKFYF